MGICTPTLKGNVVFKLRDETGKMQRDDEARQATSLELTRWGADALERFAPLVGSTPRRLIRFVNVYRLINTSLPAEVLERFVSGK